MIFQGSDILCFTRYKLAIFSFTLWIPYDGFGGLSASIVQSGTCVVGLISHAVPGCGLLAYVPSTTWVVRYALYIIVQ